MKTLQGNSSKFKDAMIKKNLNNKEADLDPTSLQNKISFVTFYPQLSCRTSQICCASANIFSKPRSSTDFFGFQI